jgi:hypothetical protein
MANEFQNVNVPIATSAIPNVTTGGKKSTWYEALAQAWGQAMDNQAGQVESLAQQLNDGNDKPSTIAQLTAESQKMMFLATSEASSVNSVGSSLETMARKS